MMVSKQNYYLFLFQYTQDASDHKHEGFCVFWIGSYNHCGYW